MTTLKQYIISMIGTTSLVLVIMISCTNPTVPKVSQHHVVDSLKMSVESENVSELTENRSLPAESKPTVEPNFDIPNGYQLFESIQGDLNGDSLPDRVLIIKGTEKENIVVNRFDEVVDRNRRGIMIYLTSNTGIDLTIQNLECFSSENEDGGVYFPPELYFDIKKGKLYIHYAHGRYGYWRYTFRYQNDDFELIGYDQSSNHGPIVNRQVSVNFLTKKKLIRENINRETEDSGDEIFEETWEDIDFDKLYRLSEIEDFDELDVLE